MCVLTHLVLALHDIHSRMALIGVYLIVQNSLSMNAIVVAAGGNWSDCNASCVTQLILSVVFLGVGLWFLYEWSPVQSLFTEVPHTSRDGLPQSAQLHTSVPRGGQGHMDPMRELGTSGRDPRRRAQHGLQVPWAVASYVADSGDPDADEAARTRAMLARELRIQ